MLSDFITSTLGSNLVSYSGWVAGDTTFVMENTLRIYGVSTEAEASDILKLYSIAKVESYKQVLSLISTKYNFSADLSSFSRIQVFENVKSLYQDSLSESMQFYPSYVARLGTVTYEDNPYGVDIVSGF